VSVAVGVLALLSVALDVDPVPVVAAGLGLVTVAVCAWLALRSFPWLVLALLVVRPGLDWLGAGRALGPASAVGALFLVASTGWLVHRARSGTLVAPSAATWGLLVLVVAAGLSALGSVAVATSVVDAVRLASGAAMFVVLEQLLRARELTPTAVICAVGGSAAVVATHVAVQALLGQGMYDDSVGLSRLTGPFVHPSVLGKYAAVVGVMMVAWAVHSRGADRLVWTAGAVALSAVVLGTFTRAAWIALGLGVLVIAGRRSWRLVPLLGVALLAAVAVVPTLRSRVSALWNPPPPVPGVPESSLAWRMGYWQDLLPLGRINPLNGLGLNTVPVVRSEGLLPHNVWVQAFVEMGVVGLLALGLAVVCVAVTLHRAARCAGGSRGERRAGVDAAAAVAVGLLAVTLTENLLSETSTLWYAAAALTLGWAVPRPRGPLDVDVVPGGRPFARPRSR